MSQPFKRIQASVTAAMARAQGARLEARVRPLTSGDVKAIRQKVGLSQAEFAAAFGIRLGTLRHWERGDRQPHGPARVLLQIVARKPRAVRSALVA